MPLEMRVFCDRKISKAVLDRNDADGEHPGQASVVFVPIIDLNLRYLTCINSTLHFVCDHARRYDLMPVLTFY